MFIDGRTLPQGTVIETVIAIIGAGAAGITLARELRNSRREITLIESGSLELDADTQALYEGQSGAVEYPLAESRLRFFGGTTNHWGGWCRPLLPIDFAGRPDLNIPAWPLTRAELGPYYHRAQSICQLGAFDFDDAAPWQARMNLAPMQLPGDELVTRFFIYSPPTRFGEVYRDDVGKAANVKTYLNSNVIEILPDAAANRIEQLKQEVFGPVLHVVRYARQDLDRVIDEVNALGFGLTFGLHTRLDETIDRVTSRIHAGNIYVNRNIIGAVVGVQPFGGQGMSGTGPKAGGPLYLRRLVRQRPADNDIAELLPGPVGESNLYRTAPRGEILLLPQTREGLSLLLDAVAATRNAPVIDAELVGAAVVRELAPQARLAAALANETSVDGVLVEGGPERVASIARQVAEFAGRIIPVQSAADVNRDMLVHEISVSINTAAAGGNASLMALAER